MTTITRNTRRGLIVYVAGPYRDPSNWEIHKNIFQAECAAFEVWKAGLSALSPHLNTAHFQYALPDEAWLEGDLAMLARCDAMLVISGWEKSKGTLAEIEFARTKLIPVFFNMPALTDWADGIVFLPADQKNL